MKKIKEIKWVILVCLFAVCYACLPILCVFLGQNRSIEYRWGCVTAILIPTGAFFYPVIKSNDKLKKVFHRKDSVALLLITTILNIIAFIIYLNIEHLAYR